MHSSFGHLIHQCCPIGLEKRETQIDAIIEILFRPNTRLASLNRTPESRSREACLRSPHRPGRRWIVLPGRHGGTARGGRRGHLPGCPNLRAESSDLCGSAGGEAHYSRWQSLTSCTVLEVASGGPLSRKGTFNGKKKKEREKLKRNTLRISGYYFSF